jgi:hypothetical protein
VRKHAAVAIGAERRDGGAAARELAVGERANVSCRQVGEYAVEVNHDPANLRGVGILLRHRPESADNGDGGCGNCGGRDQTNQCHARPLMVKE